MDGRQWWTPRKKARRLDMAVIGPSKNTRPERVFRAMLISRRLKFRCHPPIPGMPRRSADFLVNGVYVFIHGRFWHDSSHATRRMSRLWRDKVSKNERRDYETREHLRIHGHTSTVIWDDQFTKTRIWEVKEVISRLLAKPSAS